MNEHKTPAKWSRDTGDILKDALANLAEGLTGLAASERKELVFSVGHIFQSLLKGQFLSQLMNEWNDYREKGRIKDDYLGTEQYRACLQEMLDFLDKDTPDDLRFTFLKKIFLTAATEKISKRDSFLPQQYMHICRRLTSGEVIVLKTTYEITKAGGSDTLEKSAKAWLNKVADESGLKYPELIEIHERELMEKNLLMNRRHSDRSGISLGGHYRLTGLGFEICQFIEHYDELSEGKGGKK